MKKKKKSNSSSLKWDPYEVSLIYTMEDGSTQELLVEEAELLHMQIPPHSEAFKNGALSKSEKIAQAKAHTESKGWKAPAPAPIEEEAPKKPADRYETSTWSKMARQHNFLRKGARTRLLPQVQNQFSAAKGSQGYYSCLLELSYVFSDYYWSINSERRSNYLGEYAEIFDRYEVEANNLEELSKRAKEEFGGIILEFNQWSKLFNYPVFTVGVTGGLVKLLMNDKFNDWLRRFVNAELRNVNSGKKPKTIVQICRQ